MRLRFTIRDFLLCTIILALSFGWWLDHRRLAIDLAVEKDFKINMLRENLANYERHRSVHGETNTIVDDIKWLEKQIKDRETELGR
jgi:hypothetical protein